MYIPIKNVGNPKNCLFKNRLNVAVSFEWPNIVLKLMDKKNNQAKLKIPYLHLCLF